MNKGTSIDQQANRARQAASKGSRNEGMKQAILSKASIANKESKMGQQNKQLVQGRLCKQGEQR